MRLCLTCRYLSPKEAIFCAHCARSFGGRRCPRGHLAPMQAICCPECGRAELSEATRSFNLGLPLGLLFGGVGIAFLISLIPLVRAAAPPAMSWLYLTAKGIFNVGILVVIVLYLIPGRLGQEVRRGMGRSFRALWRLLVGLHLLRTLGRLALRMASSGDRPRRY